MGRCSKPASSSTASTHLFDRCFRWRERQLTAKGGAIGMSILWILLIVILVLALLGFFSRGYW